MRVVHLGKYYRPHKGGIETVVEAMCRTLAKSGVDVTVLVSSDTPHGSEDELDGVRVQRIPRLAELWSQPINPALVSALRRLDFDVLHVHTPNPLGALAALASHRRRPLVVTHHSDIVRQKVLGLPAVAMHATLYARARAVVAPTPNHVEYSRLLRAFRSKCRIIPFAAPQAPSSTQTPRLPDGFLSEPLVLFVGRLVYYKGVDVLLDALSRTDHGRLAIVGIGPLRDALEARSRALGLAERVHFCGEVAQAELHALYAACSVFVLPSVEPSEAFGMVQLEAMSAGRPVISTQLRSGVPFVNQHEQSGIVVPPRDAPALAGALRRLLGDDALRARLGRGALQRVASHFCSTKITAQWLELYERVLH